MIPRDAAELLDETRADVDAEIAQLEETNRHLQALHDIRTSTPVQESPCGASPASSPSLLSLPPLPPSGP